jgi:hypothetical protein
VDYCTAPGSAFDGVGVVFGFIAAVSLVGIMIGIFGALMLAMIIGSFWKDKEGSHGSSTGYIKDGKEFGVEMREVV